MKPNSNVFRSIIGFVLLTTVPVVLAEVHLGENDGVTDEALLHIGRLTRLKALILWDAPITDAGLKHLTGLKKLTVLDLAFATRISNEGLVHISALPKLEKLNLAGTKVNDVSGLSRWSTLRELKLGNKRPAGIDTLKKSNGKVAIIS